MFNRILCTLGLSAAVLAAAPLAAFAQEAPDYNYFGVGGGDEGFVVNGKVSLSDNLSVRPSVSTDFDFDDGEVFADGLRNEVGLAFDKSGVLWGVENGADNLYREDLGGRIHNENPAEVREYRNKFKEKFTD